MDSSTMNHGTQQQTASKIFRNKADKCKPEVANHKKSQVYDTQERFPMIFPGSFQLCCTITEGSFVRMKVCGGVFSRVKWRYFIK